MSTEIQIKTSSDLTLSDQYLIKRFCKQYKQALLQTSDFNLLLFYSQQPIGMVRLIATEQSNHFWFRGLFIHPEFRHQGYARQLTQQLEYFVKSRLCTQLRQSDLKITLFALKHLENFYLSESYEYSEAASLPKRLASEWQKAQQSGKPWVLLQKTLKCG